MNRKLKVYSMNLQNLKELVLTFQTTFYIHIVEMLSLLHSLQIFHVYLTPYVSYWVYQLVALWSYYNTGWHHLASRCIKYLSYNHPNLKRISSSQLFIHVWTHVFLSVSLIHTSLKVQILQKDYFRFIHILN